jgi:hypothetical protein
MAAMTDSSSPQAKGRFTVECTAFHSVRRNTLRGYATIVVKELRLRISDIAIHERDGGRWSHLPAKAMVRDGELVKDGPRKPRYVPILEFVDAKVGRVFSSRVCEAVERLEPDAFAPDTPDEPAT